MDDEGAGADPDANANGSEGASAVGVDWREWGPEAFAEARERDAPLLLSLTATWCSA